MSAETADHAFRRFADEGVPPIRLAGERVGEMYFDERDGEGAGCIEECYGGVAVAAGVEDHRRCGGARLVNPVDEFALAIALPEDYIPASFARSCTHRLFDISERLTAIDFRLPLAQEIEIGAVQHIYRTRVSARVLGHDSPVGFDALPLYTGPQPLRKPSFRQRE